MTKRLVIAEKPSVGMSIASVLGVKDRKDGYIEGRDYIVSWGFWRNSPMPTPMMKSTPSGDTMTFPLFLPTGSIKFQGINTDSLKR